MCAATKNVFRSMSHYDLVRRAIVNVTCSWSIKRRWSVDRSMAIANNATCIWSYTINECNERRAPSNILRVRTRCERRQHDTTALLLHDAAARTRAHTLMQLGHAYRRLDSILCAPTTQLSRRTFQLYCERRRDVNDILSLFIGSRNTVLRSIENCCQ